MVISKSKVKYFNLPLPTHQPPQEVVRRSLAAASRGGLLNFPHIAPIQCFWIVLQSNGKMCVSSARTTAAKQCHGSILS